MTHHSETITSNHDGAPNFRKPDCILSKKVYLDAIYRGAVKDDLTHLETPPKETFLPWHQAFLIAEFKKRDRAIPKPPKYLEINPTLDAPAEPVTTVKEFEDHIAELQQPLPPQEETSAIPTGSSTGQQGSGDNEMKSAG